MANTRLTAKQAAFALAILSGATSRHAYRTVYVATPMSDASVDVAASKLVNLPKITIRLAELRDVVAQKAAWTVSRVISEIEATAKEARESGDRATAMRGYELIGRHIGMWPRSAPQVSIDNRTQSLTIEGAGLTVEQMRKVAMRVLEGDE